MLVRESMAKTPSKKGRISENQRPAWMSSEPVATPSKPMVIPTRTRYGRARRSKEVSPKTCDSLEKALHAHDPTATPCSVALLNAMTSPINAGDKHVKRKDYRPDGSSHRKRSREGSAKVGQSTMSAASPQSWSVLLTPPDETDLESSSIGSESTLETASFVRSLSSDSIPPLDTDYGSSRSVSGISTPRTPSSFHGGNEKRSKESSSLKTEDCLLDHPLLAIFPAEDTKEDRAILDIEPMLPEPRSPLRRKSGFKSNLTASFARLRAAARSLPNLGTPAISRDEFFTSSLLSMVPSFTDERRPRPSDETPDPALRRYLNPITASPAELQSHHEHAPSQKVRSPCNTSVQLQTYRRSPKLSDKASAPPIFLSTNTAAAAADEPFLTHLPRQREPRENSDFLRVVVLEMNMRRNRRMDDTAPGKARLWLPARQGGKGEARKVEAIPRRWIGVTSELK